MQIKCECGKKIRVPDNSTKKRIKCPACEAVLNLPSRRKRPQAKPGDDSLQAPESPAPRRKKSRKEKPQTRKPQKRVRYILPAALAIGSILAVGLFALVWGVFSDGMGLPNFFVSEPVELELVGKCELKAYRSVGGAGFSVSADRAFLADRGRVTMVDVSNRQNPQIIGPMEERQDVSFNTALLECGVISRLRGIIIRKYNCYLRVSVSGKKGVWLCAPTTIGEGRRMAQETIGLYKTIESISKRGHFYAEVPLTSSITYPSTAVAYADGHLFLGHGNASNRDGIVRLEIHDIDFLSRETKLVGTCDVKEMGFETRLHSLYVDYPFVYGVTARAEKYTPEMRDELQKYPDWADATTGLFPYVVVMNFANTKKIRVISSCYFGRHDGLPGAPEGTQIAVNSHSSVLCLMHSANTLTFIDVSEPESPNEIRKYDIQKENGWLRPSLKLVDDLVYLTTSGGIAVYDVSGPDNIRQVAQFNFKNRLLSPPRLAVQHEFLYVLKRDELLILRKPKL